MKRVIRLGTRESALALWQANTVKTQMEALGFKVELVPVTSTGDMVRDQPLYAMGITGIFTKNLDLALLEDRVDMAVHSLKDVPTLLPDGLYLGAVLKRGNPRDVLVHKGLDFLNEEGVIATGSLRRKAQWLHRYPLHEVEGLRGNVETRLKKLSDSDWNAAIFAAAGLERLGISTKSSTVLQWMIPAPAQGAIGVVVRENDAQMVAALNHPETNLCTKIERSFLRELEGGCSAPIGAYAEIEDGQVIFEGEVYSLDGSRRIASSAKVQAEEADNLGIECARDILERGGRELIQEIRSNLPS